MSSIDLEKITDQKFKNLLKQYKETKNPISLLYLLRHKNILLNKDKIDGVIVKWEEEHNIIWMGGVIVNGELYKAILHVYQDGEAVLDFYHDYNIEIQVNDDD